MDENKDDEFICCMEKVALIAFMSVTSNFLGNSKAPNYKEYNII